MTDGLPKVMQVEPATRPFAIAIAYSRLPLPMIRADQMTVAHLISFFAASMRSITAKKSAHRTVNGWKMSAAACRFLITVLSAD
jgi:hypothetical protein